MSPLVITLTFLTLMGMISSSEMHQHHTSFLSHHLYTSYLAQEAKIDTLYAQSLLEDIGTTSSTTTKETTTAPEDSPGERAPSKSKKVVKYGNDLSIYPTRPPNNSRFNFYHLVHENNPSVNAPAHFNYLEMGAKLMRHLYQGEAFFHEVLDAEYLILNKLIEKKELTIDFSTPDELSSICLDDEKLQTIFYHMLKGAYSSEGGGYPSLLHYITFDETGSHQINFLYTHPLMIELLFEEQEIIASLLDLKEQYWEQILYHQAHRLDEKRMDWPNRTTLKKELKESILAILAPYRHKNYTHLLDFTLGKAGTILFVEDDATGIVIRKKYAPKKCRAA